MSVFGEMVDRTAVEAAVIEHMKTWLPTYIAEVERQKGWAEQRLQPIVNYTVVATAWERWPEDQFPSLLIMSPGLAEPPKAEGDGRVRAKWACGIAAITEGGGDDPSLDAKETAGAYFAAIRGAMLQHPGLGGFANGVTWTDERYDQVPSESERSLATAYGMFSIEVPQAVDRLGGVAEPLDNPYQEPPAWPTVGEGNATAEVAPE